MVLSQWPWARHSRVNQSECRPDFTQSFLCSFLSHLGLTYTSKSIKVFKNQVVMVPAGSFWSRIPKVWPCKLMMELWGHPSYSSTHDTSQSRQGLALYVLSTARRYSLGHQICFKDLLGFLVGEVHGQKGKSADLITCLASWFLASRGFLTWCESLSLTGVLQRKHVSQPDLHTWIMSALPCNWKGDLGHRSGRKHSQT